MATDFFGALPFNEEEFRKAGIRRRSARLVTGEISKIRRRPQPLNRVHPPEDPGTLGEGLRLAVQSHEDLGSTYEPSVRRGLQRRLVYKDVPPQDVFNPISLRDTGETATRFLNRPSEPKNYVTPPGEFVGPQLPPGSFTTEQIQAELRDLPKPEPLRIRDASAVRNLLDNTLPLEPGAESLGASISATDLARIPEDGSTQTLGPGSFRGIGRVIEGTPTFSDRFPETSRYVNEIERGLARRDADLEARSTPFENSLRRVQATAPFIPYEQQVGLARRLAANQSDLEAERLRAQSRLREVALQGAYDLARQELANRGAARAATLRQAVSNRAAPAKLGLVDKTLPNLTFQDEGETKVNPVAASQYLSTFAEEVRQNPEILARPGLTAAGRAAAKLIPGQLKNIFNNESQNMPGHFFNLIDTASEDSFEDLGSANLSGDLPTLFAKLASAGVRYDPVKGGLVSLQDPSVALPLENYPGLRAVLSQVLPVYQPEL